MSSCCLQGLRVCTVDRPSEDLSLSLSYFPLFFLSPVLPSSQSLFLHFSFLVAFLFLPSLHSRDIFQHHLLSILSKLAKCVTTCTTTSGRRGRRGMRRRTERRGHEKRREERTGGEEKRREETNRKKKVGVGREGKGEGQRGDMSREG